MHLRSRGREHEFVIRRGGRPQRAFAAPLAALRHAMASQAAVEAPRRRSWSGSQGAGRRPRARRVRPQALAGCRAWLVCRPHTMSPLRRDRDLICSSSSSTISCHLLLVVALESLTARHFVWLIVWLQLLRLQRRQFLRFESFLRQFLRFESFLRLEV